LKETLDFALRVFLKQGIWIVGAAWLLAALSRAIYSRADQTGESRGDRPCAAKRKIILGVLVLVLGIFIALLPVP
jgi:hypothetical protein